MKNRSLILVFGLLMFLGACGDSAAKLEEHLARGERYREEQSWAEAVLEYKNALQIDPNSAAAHWGLAQSYSGDRKLREAYWELKETVRLDPANVDAKLQYGQYLLFGKQSDLEEAVARAEEVLAADPERWEAHVLKGRAHEALKDEALAHRSYARAVEVAPEEAAPWLQLASFERNRGKPEAAEAAFRKLTEVKPSFMAWAALGGFLASERRAEEAEASYLEALASAEEVEAVSAHSLLANFYFSLERYDEAERLLRKGLEGAPGDLDLIYGLARFYNARGQSDKADAMIQEATLSNPENAAPHLVLSAYRGRQGDLAGALEAADQALAVDPDSLDARLRKAELLVDMGYRAEDNSQIASGRAIVEAVLAKEPSNPEALFVRAKIDIAEGRPAEAVAGLRRCIDVRPGWAQAHFLLGSALFLERDLNGARAEIARALEIDADMLEAKRVLARIHAAARESEQAVEAGRSVLAQVPDDYGLRILVAQALVRLNRLDEARQELERIPAAARDAEARYALGRVLHLQGEPGAARKSLEAALALEPTRYEILRSLLDLDLREDRLADSAQRIRTALVERPDDARLLQLEGLVALYGGNTEAAEQSFRRAIELDPNDLQGYENLARYLLVSGRPEEVLRTYEEALENNPKSGTLHLIVGSLYELRSRTGEAIERYESALKVDPSLAVAKNNLAYLLAESGGDLDRALSLAQEAKEMLPDNPSAADTLGWVLFRKNVPSAAVGYLKEAVAGLRPEDPQLGTVRHHLAQAYEAAGQPDQARSVLEQALRDWDARAAGEGPEKPEPAWASEARGMLKRLKTQEG